jgi:hypothetical protein
MDYAKAKFYHQLLEQCYSSPRCIEPSSITARRSRLVQKFAPDLEESQIVGIAELIRKSNI